jgi:hypothetical protein
VIGVPFDDRARFSIGKCPALLEHLTIVANDDLKERSRRRAIEPPPCSRPPAVVAPDNLGGLVSVISYSVEDDAQWLSARISV